MADSQSECRSGVYFGSPCLLKYGSSRAAGLTYGYAWVLGEHWNIEATAGIGVMRYRQFKYDKGTPKPKTVNDSKTTIAPVKLGVSFVYIIR